MIVIVNLDNHNGMMFNNRRQSQDSYLTDRIAKISDKSTLWMNDYSSALFENYLSNDNVSVDNHFLSKAKLNEYCFVENIPLKEYIDQIENIIIYKWNRTYPCDMFFDISLDNYALIATTEFAGKSHKNITEEIYKKIK